MAALTGGLGFAAVKVLDKVETDSRAASVSQTALTSPRYEVRRSVLFGPNGVRVEGFRSWASWDPESAAEEGVKEVDENCGPVRQRERLGQGVIVVQVPNRDKCFLPLFKSKSKRE